jgi:hypothetical protein
MAKIFSNYTGLWMSKLSKKQRCMFLILELLAVFNKDQAQDPFTIMHPLLINSTDINMAL